MHAHPVDPTSFSYVTMWTPAGYIIVRTDDPRLLAQNELNERLNDIEQRLQRLEGS